MSASHILRMLFHFYFIFWHIIIFARLFAIWHQTHTPKLLAQTLESSICLRCVFVYLLFFLLLFRLFYSEWQKLVFFSFFESISLFVIVLLCLFKRNWYFEFSMFILKNRILLSDLLEHLIYFRYLCVYVFLDSVFNNPEPKNGRMLSYWNSTHRIVFFFFVRKSKGQRKTHSNRAHRAYTSLERVPYRIWNIKNLLLRWKWKAATPKQIEPTHNTHTHTYKCRLFSV